MRIESVARRWGIQGPCCRTASLSFDGPTLYSYRTAIAHIYLPEGITLVNSQHYSRTTSRHQALARANAPTPGMVIDVPRCCPGNVTEHQHNQEHLLTSYRQMIVQARRSRETYRREWKLRRAQELGLHALRYAAVFNLPPPQITPDIDVTEIERVPLPADNESLQDTVFNHIGD